LDGCDVSPDSAHLGPAGAWQHRGGGSGAVLAAEDWLHVASHLGWFKVEAQWRNLVLAVVRIGLANGTPMSDIDFLGNIDQHTRMNGGKKKADNMHAACQSQLVQMARCSFVTTSAR
jgi:hypothetical protein